MPPTGRAKYPVANAANDAINDTVGDVLGKIASAMSLAKMPKMTKS